MQKVTGSHNLKREWGLKDLGVKEVFTIKGQKESYISLQSRCKHVGIFGVDNSFLGKNFTLGRSFNQLNVERCNFLVETEQGIGPKFCLDIPFGFEENEGAGFGFCFTMVANFEDEGGPSSK